MFAQPWAPRDCPPCFYVIGPVQKDIKATWLLTHCASDSSSIWHKLEMNVFFGGGTHYLHHIWRKKFHSPAGGLLQLLSIQFYPPNFQSPQETPAECCDKEWDFGGERRTYSSIFIKKNTVGGYSRFCLSLHELSCMSMNTDTDTTWQYHFSFTLTVCLFFTVSVNTIPGAEGSSSCPLEDASGDRGMISPPVARAESLSGFSKGCVSTGCSANILREECLWLDVVALKNAAGSDGIQVWVYIVMCVCVGGEATVPAPRPDNAAGPSVQEQSLKGPRLNDGMKERQRWAEEKGQSLV